jgi:MFS superfamily sulfate permease-like transporter
MASIKAPGGGAAAPGVGSARLSDLKSGFMVFLIALPLCLGIASASNCPAIAGVYTAIAGGLIATLLSNSQLTIKGPAAGLIVIVLGCMNEFSTYYTKQTDAFAATGATDVAFAAYRATLAICVVSGVMQVLFGAIKGGALGDFFPSSAVHGLLASIGVIIIAKQVPVALGVSQSYLLDEHGNQPEPLFLILSLPKVVALHYDAQIAAIGVVGVLIMFGLPAFSQKLVKAVPSQLVVLLVTIPLAVFVLGVPHPAVTIGGYELLSEKKPPPVDTPKETPKEADLNASTVSTGSLVNEAGKDAGVHAAPTPVKPYQPLVKVPNDVGTQLKNTASDLAAMKFLPYFDVLWSHDTWIMSLKWVALFSIIGSLESLLSAKAVDTLDPKKRKTDLNRDLLAVGVANTAVAFFGGIPMIAEIVRSRANIDNGAQSRMSNFFHGMFLLLSILTIPMLLNLIPMAALASMLIFTGFRLAHPREFMHVYHLGREQLVVFVATILGVLATDLLQGICIGIAVKLLIHFINGVPVRSLFKPFLTIEQHDPNTYLIRASQSAVFSNWLLFRKQIYTYGFLQDKNIIVDLSETRLVDHTVMEKLQEVKRDFEGKGLSLEIRGLDKHVSVSGHPNAARIRPTSELASHH